MGLTYKQINKELDSIKAWYEDYSHNDRYNKYIAVNVKRYNDYIDIDDLIDEIISSNPIYKDYPELKNYLVNDCQWINDIPGINDAKRVYSYYDLWLEDQTNYLFESYFYNIDLTDSEQIFLKVLENYNITSKWKYPLACQFGRSGGWIAIVGYKDICSNLDTLEDYLYNAQTDKEYYQYCIDMLDTIRVEFQAVQWFYNMVDQFNKGLDFKDELKFRISEDVEEYMQSRELDMSVNI